MPSAPPGYRETLKRRAVVDEQLDRALHDGVHDRAGPDRAARSVEPPSGWERPRDRHREREQRDGWVERPEQRHVRRRCRYMKPRNSISSAIPH
jgi:hypothetical protein